MIRRIEIDFDLPVELTTGEQMALDRLVGGICDRCCPEGWVFWPAGCGDKPMFSQADALFLGKQPDPNAPTSGEPMFDDSIYYVECCAREAYPEEIERNRQRAERKAQKAAESKSKWHARLADWLHKRGLVRASWLVADCYIFCHRNFGRGRHA